MVNMMGINYTLRARGDRMKNSRVGVLLNHSVLEKGLKGESYEELNFYVKAAKTHQVQVCFFRLADIDLQNQTVTAFQKYGNRWKQARLPLPSVIHNRGIYINEKDNSKLELLRQKGIKLYNAFNFYSKLDMYHMLHQHPVIKAYLPLTLPFSETNLTRFLKSPSFFLKPDKGSVGKGIMKVNQVSNDTCLVVQQNKKRVDSTEVATPSLYDFLSKRIGNRKYILQEAIQLQTYLQAPFDIRISVQKNRFGKWQVTGMVGKAARKGAYLSNVYQGGRVVRLEQLFPQEGERNRVQGELSQAALLIVQHLDQYFPHLADVGFDFGIDRSGRLYFIEMNGRDQRYSFRLAGLRQIFYKTYENPIGYGRYLLEHAP